MSVKRALMLLADGYEDMEAVAPIDVLTRVGVVVTVAGVRPGPLSAAFGTSITPHCTINDIGSDLYDVVILPGGMANARTLGEDKRVISIIKKHVAEGKLVAAICASPALVLAEGANILAGRVACGDPGCNETLIRHGVVLSDNAVTVDRRLITATGPSAALVFGLSIARELLGPVAIQPMLDRWRLRLDY